MYEFWYDNVKPKYCEKAKLCFFVLIKTDDIYEMLKLDLILQILNQIDHYLKGKNGLIKVELGGKLNKESAVLRSENYGCLMNDISEDKRQQTQKSHKKKT